MKIHDFFDLIIGTSTGGIIACALANGVPASHLPPLYKSKAGDIFKPNKHFRELDGLESGVMGTFDKLKFGLHSFLYRDEIETPTKYTSSGLKDLLS